MPEVALPVVGQTDIQADPGDLRRELRSVVETGKRLLPLLAPHMNDAQVGVRSGHPGVERQDALEAALGAIEVSLSKRVLPFGKHFRGILTGRGGGGPGPSRSFLCESRRRSP